MSLLCTCEWSKVRGGKVKGTINLAVKCEILAPERGTNISAGISSKTCCEESHSAVDFTDEIGASASEIDVFLDTRYKYDLSPGRGELLSAKTEHETFQKAYTE